MRYLIAPLVLMSAVLPFPARAADACRKVIDPAARLACYDARHGAPSAPSAIPVPTRASAPAVASEHAVEERGVRLSRSKGMALAGDGRIAAVRPLAHGYWRVELADGQALETTQVGAAPRVGSAVHLRHTLMGTNFMDVHGGRAFTVRRERPAD